MRHGEGRQTFARDDSVERTSYRTSLTFEAPKRPKYFFVFAEDLANIVEDSDDREKKESVEQEYLGCPIGDEVLIALRKAFTHTYFSEDQLRPRKEAVDEIRRVALDALCPLSAILQRLKLPAASNPNPDEKGCGVFKYVIAPAKQVRQRVKDEATGRHVPLIQLIMAEPADHTVRALRHVLKLTFSEVYTDNDYNNLLAEIRRIAADVLLPLNWMLEEIEVEPVAIPKVLGDEPHLQDEDGPESGEDEGANAEVEHIRGAIGGK